MADYELSLQMVDSMGRTTTKRIEMKPDVLLADMILAGQAVVDALEDVTDLGVVRGDIVIKAALTGFAVTEGANVDVGATFSGYIEGGNGKKASHKVPGFKASLVNEDATITLDGVTATYLGKFVDPGYIAMLSDGERIDAWIKGALDR